MSAWAKRLLLQAAHRSPTVLRALKAVRGSDGSAFHDTERWEREYRAGGWDWLSAPHEALHHRIVAGYCDMTAASPRVLDLGCGEGILNRALRLSGYQTYVGVDLSPTAIERASTMADAKTSFIAANVDAFDTDETFDCIIFNESIYYVTDPAATLARLVRHLAPGGRFIVSTSMDSLRDGVHILKIWQQLGAMFQVVDELTLLHGNGGAVRIIKLLAPAGTVQQALRVASDVAQAPDDGLVTPAGALTEQPGQ